MSKYCPFCKKNGEVESFWRSHSLRDENNEVVCPVLKKYTCPICDKTGHHTASYCPQNSLSGKKKTGFSPKRQTTSGRPAIQPLKPSLNINQQQSKICDENNNNNNSIIINNNNNYKVNINNGLDNTERVMKLNFNSLPPYFVGDHKQDLTLFKAALISAQIVQPSEQRLNYLIERGYNPERIDFVRQAAYIANYAMIQMGIF